MTELRTMPRPIIAAAGWLILLAAAAGLVLGVLRNKAHGGAVDDTTEIVAPIKTVANAQPLTTPPVTETDVRRWVREEMQASQAARAPKKPKADDQAAPDAKAATDDGASTTATPTGAANPTAGTTPAIKPATAAKTNTTAQKSAAPQIPF